ncbi:hypothetical protein ABK040_011326 [Willaertia magna]
MPSFNFFKFLKRKFSGSIPSTEENNETTNNEENEEKTFKMVLMGNSSGKSTLFKQFGKLKVTNYLKDEEELKNYKGIIYYNILQSLCYLIECVRSKDEEFTNKELVDNFLNNFTDDFIKYSSAKYWTGNLFEMIEKIYNNEPILQDLLKSDNITTDYFGRNLIYYMKHFNRIKQDNYIPTFQDILNIKNKTTGINEYKDNFLQYHVVNLLDSKECSDCIDCILNQSGRFISPLLLKSLQKNSYKIILFKSLMNENLCDVEIIIE